ncbi:hypothetical protein VaNZ11_002143 [Volvox africanus]|uniref:Uncharacterized protein n=1 Tax=Volvox africanus TaxID=51714 RepID=A0ABQ5RRC4_9CHLO|nr:hypothetical protein VaNZ11_002143 [Volvox africanus]
MGDAAVNVVATVTMGVSSILMPKVVFKGDNWNEFRRDVENCFLYNVWASALTSLDDPATFKALIVLRRQVAQEYQIELSDCENAKVAWDHLKNIGERSSSAKLIVLMRTLHSLKMQSEENVYQYFARGKELRQMLADAGEKIEERVLVLALLTGLTNRFRTFVDIIMVSGEIPKLEVLLPKLVAVESFESQLGASGDGALALFSGSGRN